MCLSACKYDHAKDTHAKLAIMAKCEPGLLSRCRLRSARRPPCKARRCGDGVFCARPDRVHVRVRARSPRHYISYKQDCASNPHDCNIDSMGCGGEYRADMLSR